jgi:hypothetical protein
MGAGERCDLLGFKPPVLGRGPAVPSVHLYREINGDDMRYPDIDGPDPT